MYRKSMHRLYWLLFVGSIVPHFFEAIANKDLNAQKTHRNIASKNVFRSRDILHDHHHRQFQQLNTLTSFFFDQATAQAAASSHYSNHHAFPNIEGLEGDLTADLSGFPITDLSRKIQLLATTDGILFMVLNQDKKTIHQTSGASTSVFDSIDEDIAQVAAGGGYVATLSQSGQVNVWNSGGTHLSSIAAGDLASSIAVNGENSGSVYVSIGQAIEKYQADGTLVDTFPKALDLGNIVGNIGFISTHDSGHIYLSDNNNSNRVVDVFDDTTSERLNQVSFTLISSNTQAQARNNRFYMSRENLGGTFNYINVMDFTDVNNPVEGLYMMGDPPTYTGQFVVTDDTVLALSTGLFVAPVPRIIAWKNLDPSTFPVGGLNLPAQDDSDLAFNITPNGGETFQMITGDQDYVVALSEDAGNNQFLRSYATSNGASNATFTLPLSTSVNFIASSDGDKVFVVHSGAGAQTVYSWPNTGGAATAFSVTTSGTITSLKAEGSFVAAAHSGNTVDVWDTSGTHLQTIVASGGSIKDFAINNDDGGFIYIAIFNTNKYEKHKIADGSRDGQATALTNEINQLSISPLPGSGSPLLYALHADEKTIEAVHSVDGNIVGSAINDEVVNLMASVKAGTVDLLYLVHGSTIEFFNGSTVGTPFAQTTLNQLIVGLAATADGNIFASNSSSVHAWSTDGSSITSLSASPLPLSGIIRLMAAESDLYVVHDINVAGV